MSRFLAVAMGFSRVLVWHLQSHFRQRKLWSLCWGKETGIVRFIRSQSLPTTAMRCSKIFRELNLEGQRLMFELRFAVPPKR